MTAGDHSTIQISLRGVGHRFGEGPWLFRGVDSTFVAGDLVAVTGPSGSGKSTLLSLVAGGAPTEGTIERSRGRLQWIFQNPYGSAHRSAADHVALPFLARGMSRAEAEPEVQRLLERFNLSESSATPFRTLSGGQAQRLMLARALAAEPTLILVDEPTSQLDPVNATMVIDVLQELAGEDRTVLIATHDPRVADRATQRLILGERDGTS
ncbi:ATP-binding cassette domain-containing protein [Zhihengliuella sp.]|uniref:ABC transporter ATP-binding protein n=1 Tax=Zhihengliuella sp. TaxID=1954483 RepID=UPI002810F53D|nr:ATP-binding cassette domain-containing protein [Zhihengliuella sp.]